MALSIETVPELADAKAKRVPLAAVTTDDDVQPRAAISEDAIRRYKDALRNNPKCQSAWKKGSVADCVLIGR